MTQELPPLPEPSGWLVCSEFFWQKTYADAAVTYENDDRIRDGGYGSDEMVSAEPMFTADQLRTAVSEALQAQANLCARLKQEAQIHAQEARTANATIAEIYQLISGGTGEPGNWHGAQPVRDFLQAQAGEVERMRAALTKIDVIRNDIIGRQSINWSAHIYPLVAALGEAGFEGLGYEDARAAILAARTKGTP